jgi:hypothetical protein
MQIQLEKFMNISIDVVEIDKDPLAMKMDVKVICQEGNAQVTYTTSTWSGCYHWDGFVSGLKNLPVQGSEFCSVRGDFFLKVEREWGRKFFSCGFRSQEPGPMSSWFCAFRGEVSNECYANIIKKFSEVSKQWAEKAVAEADLAGMKVKGEA